MNRLTLDDRYSAMPWDELDDVVFDVGNVLVRFSPEEILRRVLPGEACLGRNVVGLAWKQGCGDFLFSCGGSFGCQWFRRGLLG